jgi:hypothetical protein
MLGDEPDGVGAEQLIVAERGQDRRPARLDQAVGSASTLPRRAAAQSPEGKTRFQSSGRCTNPEVSRCRNTSTNAGARP